MATNNPVILNADWTNVYEGVFSGGLQNLGNSPIVARVEDAEAGMPSAGAGGFSVPSIPIPVSLGASDVLWCRVVGSVGAVVLA